jgi:hypothetical protein
MTTGQDIFTAPKNVAPFSSFVRKLRALQDMAMLKIANKTGVRTWTVIVPASFPSSYNCLHLKLLLTFGTLELCPELKNRDILLFQDQTLSLHPLGVLFCLLHTHCQMFLTHICKK